MTTLLKLRYLVEYAAARTLLFVIGTAPLPLVLGAAELAARGIFLAWRGRRRIAIENLVRAGVCPDARAARRTALASFRNFAIMVAETVLVRRRLTPDNWQRYVGFRITPEVQALLSRPGQGVIVASAHIGNWEVAARAASTFKTVCAVYRPFNNPYLDRALHAGRSGENLRLVSRLRPEPMRFVQALAQGEIVALMIDQHVSENRVPVEFFGRRAWATKSVAMLHLITRAPLLGAFAIRTGPLRYDVHAVGPILCERTGDREADVLKITQALTSEIEKIARQYPEQYMWGHRRWKA